MGAGVVRLSASIQQVAIVWMCLVPLCSVRNWHMEDLYSEDHAVRLNIRTGCRNIEQYMTVHLRHQHAIFTYSPEMTDWCPRS